MGKFESKFRRVAYGKPKQIKGAGKVVNAGSRIGTRIVQIVYFRPEAFGYRLTKGRKR